MSRAHRWSPERSYHYAISVDIDDLDDWQIKKTYLPHFIRAGRADTVYGVRSLCAEARARGLVTFPPCNNVDERGECKGHPTAAALDAERDTWGT